MTKTALLLTIVLLVSGAAAGIQPAQVENTTLRLELNASEVFRSGLQTTPGEYQPSDYPYLSSSKPEALIPYGDTEELTNIYMPDGLIAYYPLDETTGNTANDITTTLPNNDGTHNGLNQDNLGVKGNISTAYEFDGSNDFVDTGAKLDVGELGSLTYSAWIYDTGNGGEFNVVANYDGSDGTIFRVNRNPSSGGPVQLWFGGTRHSLTDEWPHNQWVHVVATYDGQDINYYEDGDLEGSTTGTESSSSSETTMIGQRGPDDFYSEGRIDDVRIYNRSLSQKEVQRLYNYQQKDQPGTEQISATITSGGFILANTKGGTPSIESRSETVNSRTLLSRVDGSFGFSQPRTPPATRIVYRSPYNLTGDGFSIDPSGISLRSTRGLGENATVSVKPIR